MTNSFRRVAALLMLLLVTQYVASANVRVRPSDSVVAKAHPAVKAVKAPLVVASDPLPAVQQEVIESVQKEKVTEVVQQDKPVETIQKEKIVEKTVTVQEPSLVAPQNVNEEGKKTVELEAGQHIQGDGPFVVNAQQLPTDVREEIMRQLNTQYRISQEKTLQKQQPVKEEVAQVKTDHTPSENESLDAELASGIAELLTRMAVEDDVGNQYVDLEDLPLGLRAQVSEYLEKEQKLEQDEAFAEQSRRQQQAERVKAQEVSFTSLFNRQTSSEIDQLFNSLINGAMADNSAPATDGFYPQRSVPFVSSSRPIFNRGIPIIVVNPQYGSHPVYGPLPRIGVNPGAIRYPISSRTYSTEASYPYPTLGGDYPVSHGNGQYHPHDDLKAREQLANLYGGTVGPKLLPFRAMAGPVFDYVTAPADYYEDVKPEDQPTPMATYYAYYRQLYESEAEEPESRYGQSARIIPADFTVQQPRSYANYQIRRYFK